MDFLFNLGDDFKRKGTNKEPGTGLGLVLVKEFIALLNGRIHVESEENKGSTFCVHLPAAFPEGQ
jgi:signal transduction histidine kinase